MSTSGNLFTYVRVLQKRIAWFRLNVENNGTSVAALCNTIIFFFSKEWGGYFIINGIEKILRMLIMPRRNYVS